MGTTLALIGIFVISFFFAFKIDKEEIKENIFVFFLLLVFAALIGGTISLFLSSELISQKILQTEWFAAVAAIGGIGFLMAGIWFSAQYKSGFSFLISGILLGVCINQVILQSDYLYLGIFVIGDLFGYITRIFRNKKENT